MHCQCGNKLSDHDKFVTKDGDNGVKCPECGMEYVEGEMVIFSKEK